MTLNLTVLRILIWASQYPDMVGELSAEWQVWAEGASAVPKPPQKPNKPKWAMDLADCD